jgi:hypothetical protein
MIANSVSTNAIGRVKTPGGILVPRVRQVPNGHTSGGDQPTDISVSNRRVLLAPPLPEGQHEEMGTEHEDIKSSENPLTAEAISMLPLSGGSRITTDL